MEDSSVAQSRPVTMVDLSLWNSVSPLAPDAAALLLEQEPTVQPSKRAIPPPDPEQLPVVRKVTTRRSVVSRLTISRGAGSLPELAATDRSHPPSLGRLAPVMTESPPYGGDTTGPLVTMGIEAQGQRQLAVSLDASEVSRSHQISRRGWTLADHSAGHPNLSDKQAAPPSRVALSSERRCSDNEGREAARTCTGSDGGEVSGEHSAPTDGDASQEAGMPNVPLLTLAPKRSKPPAGFCKNRHIRLLSVYSWLHEIGHIILASDQSLLSLVVGSDRRCVMNGPHMSRCGKRGRTRVREAMNSGV